MWAERIGWRERRREKEKEREMVSDKDIVDTVDVRPGRDGGHGYLRDLSGSMCQCATFLGHSSTM